MSKISVVCRYFCRLPFYAPWRAFYPLRWPFARGVPFALCGGPLRVPFAPVAHPFAKIEPAVIRPRPVILYAAIMDSRDLSRLFPEIIVRKNAFRKFYRSPVFAPQVEPLFPNQVSFGKKISERFLDRSVHSVLAVAPTQSGKTGSMISTILHFLNEPSLALPSSHIFVITGHSSTEWTQQTKDRFPIEFRDNIFHRNQLADFIHKVRNLNNVLIFVDESHVAARKHQSIHSALSLAGFDDAMFDRDIKLVLVSATPDLCRKNYTIHAELFMEPSDSYCSTSTLLQAGHILQAKDLCGLDPISGKISPNTFDNIREIIPFFGPEPQYHIIRTQRGAGFGITIDNFISVFGYDDFEYIDDAYDFDFLEIKPKKHSFVFILDRLRCAKTIHKDFIGILYERNPKFVNRDAVIQGLAGRATGYHSFLPTVFTHVPSVAF